MVSEDLMNPDHALDFTADWGESFAHHGTILNHFEISRVPKESLRPTPQMETDSGMRQCLRMHISPHSVTHMDLPWALDTVRPLFGTLQAQEDFATLYSQPQVVDAVVLDLRHKQPELRSYLVDDPIGSEWEPSVRLLRALKSEVEVDTLLQRLLITPKEILEILGGDLEILVGRLVILHTGWRHAFGDGLHDLSNASWEMLHPYLVHPYLDARTTDWLIESGVAGVGIDCSNMECPIYYIDPLLVPTCYKDVYARKMRDVLSLADEETVPGGSTHTHAGCDPVHDRILGAKRILLESLDIGEEGNSGPKRDIGLYYRDDRKCLLGRSWLFPLQIRELMDACLVTVTFEPE